MEFSLRVGNMSFFVFCKLEIVIFKIVKVMTENIPFVFLYVLSIYLFYVLVIFFFYFCWHTFLRVPIRVQYLLLTFYLSNQS